MDAETPIKIVSESPAAAAVSAVVSAEAFVSFVSVAFVVPDEPELHPASIDTVKAVAIKPANQLFFILFLLTY